MDESSKVCDYCGANMPPSAGVCTNCGMNFEDEAGRALRGRVPTTLTSRVGESAKRTLAVTERNSLPLRAWAHLAGSVLAVAAAFAAISFLIPVATGPWDGSGPAIWWYTLALIGLGFASFVAGFAMLVPGEPTRPVLAVGLLLGPLLFLVPFLLWLLSAIFEFMRES